MCRNHERYVLMVDECATDELLASGDESASSVLQIPLRPSERSE